MKIDPVYATREWVSSGNWDWFVTLNPNLATRNYQISSDFIARLRDRLKRWHAISDRRLIGRQWSKLPPGHRTFFFAFPERGPKGDLVHWHCLVKSPPAPPADRLFEVYDDAWTKVCPGGQIDLGIYRQAPAWYSTKKLWKKFGTENFIISSEFQAQTLATPVHLLS